MKETFVDVVGYQLEKVHTGVIAWLLDSDRSPLEHDELVAVVKNLAPKLLGNIEANQVTSIQAIKEFSFGRRLHIDLVLVITLLDTSQRWLLIECKTDSDVRLEQLLESKKAFAFAHSPESFSTMILAVGAGHFTLAHQQDKLAKEEFLVINLSETLRIFSNLSIAGNQSIYDEWIAALKEEKNRHNRVNEVQVAENEWWELPFVRLGYRKGFPLFYVFYNKIRECLDAGPFQHWAIRSGGNNPIMEFGGIWHPVGTGENVTHLFWEFNWDELCLKAENKPGAAETVKAIRPDLIKICEVCPIVGRKPTNRPGEWVTIYKWKFNLCLETPTEIAKKTAEIISVIQPQIEALQIR